MKVPFILSIFSQTKSLFQFAKNHIYLKRKKKRIPTYDSSFSDDEEDEGNSFFEKVQKFFNVKKKNLLRKITSKIDDQTDSTYLKIKINHKIQPESYSIEDILNPKFIKKGKTIRTTHAQQFEILYNMKKSPNYFLDFLQYLNKKKKVKFKAMGKQSLFFPTEERQSLFAKKASLVHKKSFKNTSLKEKKEEGLGREINEII